jgi:hypothetical protein
MIRLLLALHPRAWRARYGAEFRELLEATPLTARTVLDVVRNALRQHVRLHRQVCQVLAALVVSSLVEVAAVHAHETANILWAPTDPVRTLLLAAVLLPWVPVATSAVRTVRRRRARA